MERKMKILRTDRGLEYLSDQLKEMCSHISIVQQLIMPYLP